MKEKEQIFYVSFGDREPITYTLAQLKVLAQNLIPPGLTCGERITLGTRWQGWPIEVAQ